MTGQNRNKYLIAVAMVLTVTAMAAAPAVSQAAEVNASLSAREGYVGVPITMYISIDNASSHKQPAIPDVAGLDIVSAGVPSRSSQTTVINGRRSDRTSITYAWHITPRREGEFRIPPVEVVADARSSFTPTITFSATKSETGDLLFVEVDGRRERIYVGQPLELTLRVWLKPFQDSQYDVTLSERDMWSLVSAEHSNWGVFAERMQELVEANERVVGRPVVREGIDGSQQTYYLYEIPATAYPKRPGQVDAGDVQIVVQYPTSLARSRDIFSRGALSIDGVRPIVQDAAVPATEVIDVPVAGRPVDYRGTVGQYEIITRATPANVKAGDPITLHIGIRGSGPMDLVQAPPLSELAELTKDFKVPDESLAGVVQKDVKVFSVSIRPRREGIKEIPGIPLSFFDPDSEQFATVHSNPIAIQVDPSENLSLASIVATRQRSSNEQQHASSESQSQLSFVNHEEADLLASAQPRRVLPLVVGLLIAPLLFLTTVGIRHRQRLHDWLGSRNAAVLRRGQRGLDHAQTAEDAVVALLAYVAERLDRSVGSLTRHDAVSGLRQQGIDGGVADLDALLSECETSCYAATHQTDLHSIVTRGKQCLTTIHGQRLVSAAKNRRGIWRAVPSFARTSTAACLVVTGLIVGLPQLASATALSDNQAAQILQEANQAYQHGQSALSDAATAKESFSAAATKYQTLVDDGTDNGKLYFNLANAYFHNGDLGRAFVNYERAAGLLPGDRAVEANRDHVRSLLVGEGDLPEGSVWHRFKTWNCDLSVDARVVAGLVAWSAIWLAAAGAGFIIAFRWQYVAIPATVAFAICATSLGLQWCQPQEPDRGVVVQNDALLREGNGQSFAAAHPSPLQVGSVVEIVQQRGDWLEVRTARGEAGWLDKENAELIPSRDWRGT